MTADRTPRHRVLLADDHADTFRSWRALLEPEFEVIGAVGDGRALVDAYERLRPDVVVTDIMMPGCDGMAAAEAILQRDAGARIVFATIHADRAMLRRALASGACGYVLKVRAADDLLPAVRAALQGDLFFSRLPPLGGPHRRRGPAPL
jgi:DNA-binding NarL/FixJ family response regulator